MEIHITLLHQWSYDPNNLLGRGGLGGVYGGRGINGEVAIKRIFKHRDQYAHREMEMAEDLVNRRFNYVLPILDAGQDAASGSYFVVMPRASTSLDKIIEMSGTLNVDYVIEVLLDITKGLLELQEAHIVHRDLKPENILYHEDRWKIADFGIARLMEKSTAPNTLKAWMSDEYAAPEQWESKTVSSKTDVYALGGIAYAMVTGLSPFADATSTAEFRNAHLTKTPPVLIHVPHALESIVTRMLAKHQDHRPNLTRIKEGLERLGTGQSQAPPPSFSEATAKVARSLAAEEASRQQQELQYNDRKSLAMDGRTQLHDLLKGLGKQVNDHSLEAIVSPTPSLYIVLGTATLETWIPESYPLNEGIFRESKWDVIMDARIKVAQVAPKPYEWSANLLFARQMPGEDYRWWEMSFWSIYGQALSPYAPFALERLSDIDNAISSTVSAPFQLARDPLPIDDEDAADFYNRWIELLGKAAMGELKRPRGFPIR